MSEQTDHGKETRVFLLALLFLFIGLKLTGHIDWSWWWVMSPLWIPFAAVLTAIAIVGLAYGVFLLVDAYAKRADRKRLKRACQQVRP